MIVSHEHRFIFFKTHKTAGTSIEVCLSTLAGADTIVTPVMPPELGHTPRNWHRRFDPLPEIRHTILLAARERGGAIGLRATARFCRATASDLRKGRTFWNHATAQLAARDRLGKRVWREYFKFAFERNPWDKAISWYFYRHRRRDAAWPTFDEWIESQPTRISDWEIYSMADEIAVDFVGRYEYLESDLRAALQTVGLDLTDPLPHAKANIRARDEHDFDVAEFESLDRRSFPT